MWKIEPACKDYRLYAEYFVEGDSCCTIKEQVTKGEVFFSAAVYSINGEECCFLYEYDFDVLKLKCLIKAKEFGWDIKGLKLI